MNAKKRKLEIDARALTLEEWLDFVLGHKKRPELFEYYRFPTDNHLQQYIETVDQRSEKEIKLLIRNFISFGGSLGSDSNYLMFLIDTKRLDEAIETREIARRLINTKEHTWEGLTWVNDLLPHHPRQAISVIEAYLLAHFWNLPDGRISGLIDAISVIRAAFLEPLTATNLPNQLSDREFEYLVAGLYKAEGFEVSITPKSADGGFDVLACKMECGSVERILVECKLYTNPIGVHIARSLVGVLDSQSATKGCLITTARFTKPAQTFAKQTARLDLVDGATLSHRLNSAFGANWPVRISEILVRCRSQLKDPKAIHS